MSNIFDCRVNRSQLKRPFSNPWASVYIARLPRRVRGLRVQGGLELIEPRTIGGRLIFLAWLRSYRSLVEALS